jgi:hypothetical protein
MLNSKLRIPRGHANGELAVGMARSHVYGARGAGVNGLTLILMALYFLLVQRRVAAL